MYPKLYVKEGEAPEFDVSDAIQGLQFLGDDTSPVITNNYQTNVGVDGSILTSTTYDKSIVTSKFQLHFGDYYDFKLAKHEIYRIFSSRSILRLRTDAEPAIVKFVKPVPFEIKPIEDGAHDSLFEIPFDNPTGYKYSLSRSDKLDTWQFGMNLPSDQDIKYHFQSTNFKVFNPSDVVIDPYFQKHDLKITIKFKGNSLRIINKTNQSSWSYNKPATKEDTIVLNGIATTLNGNPASADTDFGNLVLEKKWNAISVTGATDVDITFSFPFIYLG